MPSEMYVPAKFPELRVEYVTMINFMNWSNLYNICYHKEWLVTLR